MIQEKIEALIKENSSLRKEIEKLNELRMNRNGERIEMSEKIALLTSQSSLLYEALRHITKITGLDVPVDPDPDKRLESIESIAMEALSHFNNPEQKKGVA